MRPPHRVRKRPGSSSSGSGSSSAGDDDLVLARKSSNREIFNTGHQRWGWTKFIALDEAEPYLVNECIKAHVELAVRDQDVGTMSTFTFQHTFKHLSTTPSGERLLSAIHTDEANHSWQVSLYVQTTNRGVVPLHSAYICGALVLQTDIYVVIGSDCVPSVASFIHSFIHSSIHSFIVVLQDASATATTVAGAAVGESIRSSVWSNCGTVGRSAGSPASMLCPPSTCVGMYQCSSNPTPLLTIHGARRF